ncbi:hypothetical protein SH467x_000586 [Pirellulaceae bacterium SH467]
MDDDLEFDIAANDTATEVLRKLGSELNILSESIGETTTKSQKLEVSMVGLGAVAASLAAAYGVLKGATAAGSILGDSITEFVEIEKAAKKLDASLIQLADTIESGTNIDEKSILGWMREARGKGFAGDQIGEITKAAIGLAEAMDVSVTEAMNRARQATRGSFEAFEGLIPNIDSLVSSEEKLAAVTRLASQGLEQKKKTAGDSVAVFDRMNVELNELYETIGAMINPIRELAYDGIAVAAELLTQAFTPAIRDFEDTFGGMGESVSSASAQVAEAIVASFTLAEVAITNLSKTAEMIGAALLLPLEQSRSGWEYLFVDFIPSLLNWFSEQFTNIMKDIGVFTAGVFENIGDVAAATWDYILSGFSPQAYGELMLEVGKAGAKKFLEGMEPATEAFIAPELQISEIEKNLKEVLDGTSQDLFGEFNSKLNERIDWLHKVMNENPFEAKVDLKPNFKGGMPSEIKSIQALESRIMIRGATEDPMFRVANEQLTTLKSIDGAIKNGLGKGLVFVGTK